MSTEIALPEDLDAYDPKLAELMGQHVVSENYANQLPRLKINKQFEDDDGNAIPPATFHLELVKELEDGTTESDHYFSKAVQFRYFINYYQIRHWDEDAKEGKGAQINKTLIVQNFQKEMRDELGGTRCGKMYAKDRDGATKDVLDEDKKRQTFRVVYGLVKFDDAVDLSGGDTTLDWTPVQLQLRGSNYMPLGEVVDAIDDAGKMGWNFPLNLDLTRQKKGDTVWYVIGFDHDFNRHVPATKSDGELLLKFVDTIKVENDEIEKKYDAACKKNSGLASDQELVDSLEGDSSSSLDLDDEIPF